MAFAPWWALKILFPHRQNRVCVRRSEVGPLHNFGSHYCCLFLLAEGHRVQKSDGLFRDVNFLRVLLTSFPGIILPLKAPFLL
jgi:hypothetical protein